METLKLRDLSETNWFRSWTLLSKGMNGLRVYTPTVIGGSDHRKVVFYTRRDSGPYYLWRYDQDLATWRPSRMHNSDVVTQTFNTANWKSLPPALRARLGEHYLE